MNIQLINKFEVAVRKDATDGGRDKISLRHQAQFEASKSVLEERFDQLERREKALIALVKALRKVHECEKFKYVWWLHHTNNGPYTGEKYEDELNDAVCALYPMFKKEKRNEN